MFGIYRRNQVAIQHRFYQSFSRNATCKKKITKTCTEAKNRGLAPIFHQGLMRWNRRYLRRYDRLPPLRRPTTKRVPGEGGGTSSVIARRVSLTTQLLQDSLRSSFAEPFSHFEGRGAGAARAATGATGAPGGHGCAFFWGYWGH